MIIIGLIAVAAVGAIAVLILGRLVYLRQVHQLPKISEWQARKNAAPLSSAIVSSAIANNVDDPHGGSIE